MAPTIHLVRHAQGVHNLCQANESAHDPDLTPLGLTQCAELKASFPHHSQISRLVASPLRRTLNTCIESFGTSALYPITTLETLQEISDAPCDTGSTREVLKKEFGEKIDVENLHVGWTDKGKGSKFEPEIKKLFIRAREARCKLRELAGDGDGHIVVVSHGGFLHFLTDDWHGIPSTSPTGWKNCEYRSYQFTDSTVADDDPALRETTESWERREGTRIAPTETEQREMSAVVQKRIAPYLKYQM